MALFNDGPPSNMEDLQGHDTQLLEVAGVEGIDVTRKLALAQEELAAELTTMLSRLSGPMSGAPALSQVVVTPTLKLWHAFRTLELVYRDAHHSQLNDRYAGKRDDYRELAAWARGKLIQNGIGIAQDPVAQAAPPALETAPGALADGVWYVSAAWTNHAGEEGAGSHPATIATTGGSFRVLPAVAPANARGWNIYAGTSPGSMTRQNASPLRLGETWTQPGTLVTAGQLAGAGQEPGYLRPAPRMLQRG